MLIIHVIDYDNKGKEQQSKHNSRHTDIVCKLVFQNLKNPTTYSVFQVMDTVVVFLV
jgi:hypothetical protein